MFNAIVSNGSINVIKIGLLAVLALYIVFTIVLANQVRLMNITITQTSVSVLLQVIAVLQVIAAVSLFLYAFAIL